MPRLLRPAHALGLTAVLLVAVRLLASCLTPSQLVTDAPAIEQSLAEGCPLLTAIPVVGGFVAQACEGEESAVAAAVTQAAAELRDAGRPDAGAAAPRKLARLRRHGRVVGYCTASLAAAAQARLDAMGDGGAALDASAPDAGRDGGA